jgi:uncharacterized cupin superfamily protein
MSDDARPHPLLRAADRAGSEQVFRHPLNPRSEMHGVTLSDRVGLQRLGAHIVRLPPGKESTVAHTHTTEEELLFVLEGRGVAVIDGEEHEVGPGDFMGFSTPSVAHMMRNASDADLVYLVVGERRDVEVADFPDLGKRVIRIGRTAQMVDLEHLEQFWPPPKKG